MVLLLYGPFQRNINANRTLDFFLNGDPPKDEARNYSRTAQRDRKSLETTFAQNVTTTERGVAMVDKIKIKDLQLKHTSLQMQSAQQTKFGHDSNLLAFSLRISSLDTKLNQEVQRATATNNWKRYEKLEKEQNTLHDEMAGAHTSANVVVKISIPDLKSVATSTWSVEEDTVSFL
jgi:hypothetical protein